MLAPPPNPSPRLPTLTLAPQSLSVNLSASGVGTWLPLPLDPKSPPKHCQSSWKSVDRRYELLGGCGERSSSALSKRQLIQKNIRGGYHTCLFNFAPPSLMALSFFMCLLLPRLSSFRAFSYDTYFHYAPSPTGLILTSLHSSLTLKELRKHGKKMKLLRDHAKEKRLS
jgi:hypothetical protein